MATSDDSVTCWLGPLQQGDNAAAQQLWLRYYERLIGLASRKLRHTRQHEEAEDVALGAFDSFCRGAHQGRFPEVTDRHSLWRLLVIITARKASHHRRDARRLKRGGQNAGSGPVGYDKEATLEQIISREPTPEFVAEAADQCRYLLRRLAAPELQWIAIWRMEGYTVEEIAQKLSCDARTVKRRLDLIRRLWEEELLQ
jgi:DNA-directed RNA polymerase specialized sigma24 family protein